MTLVGLTVIVIVVIFPATNAGAVVKVTGSSWLLIVTFKSEIIELGKTNGL